MKKTCSLETFGERERERKRERERERHAIIQSFSSDKEIRKVFDSFQLYYFVVIKT